MRYIEKLTEEESQKMPATITQQLIELMGEAYHFTGIQMIYYDNNGGFTIEIPAENGKLLTYEALLAHTRKMKQEDFMKR